MGRVLCVDYGKTRVGLAASDPLGHTAQPLDVVERPKRGSLVDKVAEVARDLDASEVVVGLPLRMDGTPGVAADAARQFAKALSERIEVPVVLFDERMSSVEASRRMQAAGMPARDQRGVVDKVAAAVVLRAYLERRRTSSVPIAEANPPEPVEPEPLVDEGPPDAVGGRAAAKRRALEKRTRRRRSRRRWHPDADDR